MVYILLLWPSFLFLSCNKWRFRSFLTSLSDPLHFAFSKQHENILPTPSPWYFWCRSAILLPLNIHCIIGHIIAEIIFEQSQTVQLQQSSKLFMRNNAFPIIRSLWAKENLVSILNLVKKYKRQYDIREGVKKNRLFLGKSPKLWVDGGQES